MDMSGFGSLIGNPAGQPNPTTPTSLGAQLMALAKQMNGGGAAAPAAPSAGGGIVGGIQKLMNPAAAVPAVPGDGAMQPTIGPGTAPPASPAYSPSVGLPKGGLLGIAQGGQSNGLAGLLQHLLGGQAAPSAPLAGQMPQAGMMSGLPGTPGSPMAGPVAPPPQLPTDINPMNQF